MNLQYLLLGSFLGPLSQMKEAAAERIKSQNKETLDIEWKQYLFDRLSTGENKKMNSYRSSLLLDLESYLEKLKNGHPKSILPLNLWDFWLEEVSPNPIPAKKVFDITYIKVANMIEYIQGCIDNLKSGKPDDKVLEKIYYSAEYCSFDMIVPHDLLWEEKS